jgi:hypothetical protein
MAPSPEEASFVAGSIDSSSTAAQQARRPADVSSSIGGCTHLFNFIQVEVEVFQNSRRKGLAMSTNGTAGCVYRPAVRASTT